MKYVRNKEQNTKTGRANYKLEAAQARIHNEFASAAI
jgi:hypothetical protein